MEPATFATTEYAYNVVQVTEDDLHSWPPAKGGGGDVGGPFRMKRSELTHLPAWVDGRSQLGSTIREGHGPLVADSSGPFVTHIGGTADSDSQALAVGTTAIARSIPTAPAANVSVMLGELLREGVPKAIGAATLKNRFSDYRDIGGEYLNYQFGWAPIVSDLKSVAKAISDSEKILRQLERDSGKNVRRRFAFPPTMDVSESKGAAPPYYVYPTVSSLLMKGTDDKRTTYSFVKKQWFSGCFTFHFGLSDKNRGGLADQAKKARVLLGLDLTPEVVWNLAPWSWMADWVTNAGDVFTNMSRFSRDDLAMRYGYVMSHSKSERTITLNRIRTLQGNTFVYSNPSTTHSYETKLRLPATPYGFGLNTAGFSVRQWAILGALGISRGPNAR